MFEEAAAATEGSHYALAFIQKAKIESGQDVLINGATGAIGSAAFQLIKGLGGRVTAVCATEQLALVEGLGADRVIDYRVEDFTMDQQRYDVVLDAVGMDLWKLAIDRRCPARVISRRCSRPSTSGCLGRCSIVAGSAEEADELMQDAFVAKWSDGDRVGGMNDPTGYLYRTAMNRFRSRLRSTRVAARRVVQGRPAAGAVQGHRRLRPGGARARRPVRALP
jgi:threonine dehydrogenase-like Zn-dependent dehydrogenase